MRYIRVFPSVLLLMAVAVFCLTCISCTGGSYSIIKGRIKHSSNEITGSYQKFDGEFFKSLKLEKGQQLFASFEAETEKGSLSLLLVDPFGNTFVSVPFPEETKVREIEIDRSGRYKMKVVGEDHGGRFSVNWTINGGQ